MRLLEDAARADEAFEWLRSAAENGHLFATQFILREATRQKFLTERVSEVDGERERFSFLLYNLLKNHGVDRCGTTTCSNSGAR